MVSTRSALRQSAANVDESMGVRQLELRPQLSPVASARDIGRTPLRRFGRIKLDQIASDPNQPRIAFDEGEIERLAASIRQSGQLHPIRVRWDEVSQKWVIVTGERRYRATMAAGLDAIDCYFHDDGITQSEILEQQLVENLLRHDLKPLEEARGYPERSMLVVEPRIGKRNKFEQVINQPRFLLARFGPVAPGGRDEVAETRGKDDDRQITTDA